MIIKEAKQGSQVMRRKIQSSSIRYTYMVSDFSKRKERILNLVQSNYVWVPDNLHY